MGTVTVLARARNRQRITNLVRQLRQLDAEAQRLGFSEVSHLLGCARLSLADSTRAKRIARRSAAARQKAPFRTIASAT